MTIRTSLRAAAACMAALAYVATAPRPALAAADYSRYHSYDELTTALRDLAKRHAKLARLVEVARTRQGRSVWALEIASPAGSPLAERPALLVAANFEGDQVVGSALALYMAESLLTGYGANPAITQRLDAHVFYILPRVNPDAAEQMFAPLRTGRKTNTSPIDDDNDGRVDEDGPEDLNKDGIVTVMRVKDPAGPYMIHPEDARLMRRAEAERGEAAGYAVYWEGVDNDGDGFYNEDAAGGIDLNRNFQHKYPYYSADAGPHMVSEAESRGIMDYVLQRRHIAAIVTFGESDNLVGPPSSSGAHAPPATIDLLAFANESVTGARQVGRVTMPAAGLGGRGGRGGGEDDVDAAAGRGAGGRGGGRGVTPPAVTVDTADLEYFRTVSDRYRQLTGIRATLGTRLPAGAFFEYGYYQFGVPSFATPGWGSGSDAEARPAAPAAGSGSFDLRLARWLDAEKIDGFAAWQPFTHPTLGAVEIGGFRPYVTSNPPAARIQELGKAHTEFALALVALLPKVSIASATVTSHGGGLYRIKAEIENGGLLPTSTAQGVRARSVKPTMVQLGVDPAAIVSGAAKTSFFPVLAGSGRRQTYEWIITGKPGSTVTVKAVSQKGGSALVSLTLK